MRDKKSNLFSPLEREAINLLLAGDVPILEQRREQLKQVVAVDREFTVVGFFTNFKFADNLSPIPGEPSFAIADVGGQLEGAANGSLLRPVC